MSVAFGFSAGDFIAALKLVAEVIDALRDSGESSVECRQLLCSLFDLETALIHVKRLELDASHADQLNALKHAALQCRTTIDAFLLKIQKYQPHLHAAGPSSKAALLKQSWYKVKWALCRKEDLQKFKADLNGHTEAVNLLMNAIQLKQMAIDASNQNERHLSLKVTICESFANVMQTLTAISDAVATTVTTSKKLLEATIRIAHTDCKIFGVVLDIQDMLRRNIAPQVMLSQPVYFIDVTGMPAPFHLEFIRSREAFVAVVRSNLSGNEAAVGRIDRGEFAVSDIATSTDLDLSLPWHMCFRPGQKVDMSMILEESSPDFLIWSDMACPGCKAKDNDSTDEDVRCRGCGLTFRRIDEFVAANRSPLVSMDREFDSKLVAGGLIDAAGPQQKCAEEEEIAQELTAYRKVRLKLQWRVQVSSDRLLNGYVDLSTLEDSGFI